MKNFQIMKLDRLLTPKIEIYRIILTTSLSFFMNFCKDKTKQKYISVNSGPFMTKDITKAIMKLTRLRNNCLKNRCDTNRKAYNAQRSLCF